ncbi:hypothetical protein ACHAXR_009225 [Thalassiosira sp. AJA248-18]
MNAGPRTNHHSRSRGGHSRASRSKMYERYDVNIPKHNSRGGSGGQRWYNDEEDEDNMTTYRSKPTVLALLAAVVLLAVIVSSRDSTTMTSTPAKGGGSAKKQQQERPSYMDPDSHARSNPFAAEGHTSVMEGALEVKRVGGKKKDIVPEHFTNPSTVERDDPRSKKKRWNPCKNSAKYELERHDYEPRHGDLCRARGGLMGLYECPEGCHETAGNAPYCANDEGDQKSTATFGDKGRACRVRNPDAPLEYRCDAGSVCIMAVGTPKEQFKGDGEYHDDTCDNRCVDARNTSLIGSVGGKCTSDMDCSLAGVCLPNGKCECDPWTEGPDCSYLKFAPVDKSRLGYVNEHHSSWGGSIVQGSDGRYHMFTSEIICKEDPDVRKRCGLNNWETHSRIARVTSTDIGGPYERMDVVLPPEHHNPSVHVSPKTNDWHLFSISGPTGPIVRMISSDEGQTWGIPMAISPRQNPGPLMKDDGSTYLFYRADGMDLPSPTCSNEGISFQICPSDTESCNTPNDTPIFGHTGEDPSVFADHRGNYHMLFNALPYKCVPKFQQGGHAWSTDGINWSTPRVGAFDTRIQFTDGSSIQCERRERPQMVLDQNGKPVVMVSGVTGCPKALGDANLSSDGRFYRGADDCFTLVQMMNS